tara:strand:+ start:453 stop:776 length:324 start_codon:yes stop_codon:yes gene_type:complete
MAVPGSGQLKLFYLQRENNSINRATMFGGAAANSENYDYDNTLNPTADVIEMNPPYSIKPVKLSEAANAGGINTNNNWQHRPNMAAPFKMSEWYYYDQNRSGGGMES